MNRRNRKQWWLLALALLIASVTGCSQGASQGGNAGQLGGAFDPNNPHEYGMRGAYVGEAVKEAVEQLKPVRYEFMDAATHLDVTVDQLASGQADAATGVLLLDSAQMILKVRNGVVESIIMAGAAESEGQKYRTNRGVALYDPVEKLKRLYGEAVSSGDDLVYKGSKYQATFSIHDGKVIGFRFDLIQ